MDRQLGDRVERVERELTSREWAARILVGAFLILAVAAVAGLAIRVFLALAGFREW